MFTFFREKKDPAPALFTDVHSHLLPDLDDGVTSLEETLQIAHQFQKLGYKKIITTPHVMQDQFRNSKEDILKKYYEARAFLNANQVPLELEVAAEYYLDENLMELLELEDQILTFGERFMLFETNFISEPFHLKDFIFKAETKGYRPVLANPERYLYLQGNIHKVQDLVDRGVYLQITMSSIIGYYSKAAQHCCRKLIDQGLVHFIGSDCHRLHHAEMLNKIRQSRYFRKALDLPLLNNSL